MEKRFLNVKQCADYLNISIHFVYKLVEEKKMPHTRIGRKIIFDIQKLEHFISENSFEVVDDWPQKLNLSKR